MKKEKVYSIVKREGSSKEVLSLKKNKGRRFTKATENQRNQGEYKKNH